MPVDRERQCRPRVRALMKSPSHWELRHPLQSSREESLRPKMLQDFAVCAA